MPDFIESSSAVHEIEELARKPFILTDQYADEAFLIAVPDGFRIEDHTDKMPNPPRHKGATHLHDVRSFLISVSRFKNEASAIYVNADYGLQQVEAIAVFNDHGEETPHWRDHRAYFVPRLTNEWQRWNASNGKQMTQAEFGFFLESNLPAIASPAGGEVLEFVLTLQETRKVKYGSAINLANGLVQLSFTEEGDEAAKGKMEIFRKFELGIRPFAGGDAYSMEALLRYRIDRNSGQLTFWYDLQRPDRVLEDACEKTVELIREQAGIPVLFGTPD